jgi:hypothetical protein
MNQSFQSTDGPSLYCALVLRIVRAITSPARLSIFQTAGELTVHAGVKSSKMKKMDTEQGFLWPTAEQVEKAREELRKRIRDEELECALRREAVDGLIKLLRIDRETLHRLWIQPLMRAGATLDVALGCIAKSQFRPN